METQRLTIRRRVAAGIHYRHSFRSVCSAAAGLLPAGIFCASDFWHPMLTPFHCSMFELAAASLIVERPIFELPDNRGATMAGRKRSALPSVQIRGRDGHNVTLTRRSGKKCASVSDQRPSANVDGTAFAD